ncbi:MAG: pentapeptide repeat-containing protein [Acidobacteriota bacterium]
MFGSTARRLRVIEEKLAVLEAERSAAAVDGERSRVSLDVEHRLTTLEAERSSVGLDVERRLASLEADRPDVSTRAIEALRQEAESLRQEIELAVNPFAAFRQGKGIRQLPGWFIVSFVAAAVGAIGSIVTIALLLKQTWVLEGQLEVTQSQVDVQTEDRRAELLATLYDCRADGTMTCEPRANRRARAEAALTFIRLEKQRDTDGTKEEGVNLSHALLDDTDFFDEDQLAGHNFSQACFLGADLRSADLSDAMLRRADFTGADLQGASFRGAELEEAVLANVKSGARPTSTYSFHTGGPTAPPAYAGAHKALDFTNAKMLRVDLRGADLRGAHGLTFPQIALTFGDARTQLPEGMRRPPWEERAAAESPPPAACARTTQSSPR